MSGMGALSAGIQATASHINTAMGMIANKRSQEREQAFDKAQYQTAMEDSAGATRVQQDYNSAEAHKQRQFNAEQSQIGRDFTEKMFNKQVDLDNSAVQRRADDMEKAGINRILASGGVSPSPSSSGSPTASGGGASASASGTPTPPRANPLRHDLSKMFDGAGAISTALNVEKLQNETRKINQDIKKSQQDTATSRAQEILNKSKTQTIPAKIGATVDGVEDLVKKGKNYYDKAKPHVSKGYNKVKQWAEKQKKKWAGTSAKDVKPKSGKTKPTTTMNPNEQFNRK